MPDLELGDETTKVFVDPYGDTKGLSEGIKAFFEYLIEELTQSDFTKKLYEEVEKARENKEWRREYMAWISELEESKEEAREEGREESREQIAISMLKDNMPISKVILYSSLSESRILELQQNLAEN
ncbi:MAG: hypothetical protein K2N89_15060 [Lachnospiraceae bacterium]|nr:hypothetical protein [Lachnospiraceae bacterium]